MNTITQMCTYVVCVQIHYGHIRSTHIEIHPPVLVRSINQKRIPVQTCVSKRSRSCDEKESTVYRKIEEIPFVYRVCCVESKERYIKTFYYEKIIIYILCVYIPVRVSCMLC